MTRYTKCRLLVFFPGLLIMGCAVTCPPSEPISIMDQTPGQTEQFTQFELDVAFRRQAREDARAFVFRRTFDFCCVVFHSDLRMLEKVITHFKEHVPAYDVDDYGLLVLENEDEYLVILWERYTEAGQYEIEGFWYPGVDDGGEIRHREYGYLVDRETLEILEFSGE